MALEETVEGPVRSPYLSIEEALSQVHIPTFSPERAVRRKCRRKHQKPRLVETDVLLRKSLSAASQASITPSTKQGPVAIEGFAPLGHMKLRRLARDSQCNTDHKRWPSRGMALLPHSTTALCLTQLTGEGAVPPASTARRSVRLIWDDAVEIDDPRRNNSGAGRCPANSAEELLLTRQRRLLEWADRSTLARTVMQEREQTLTLVRHLAKQEALRLRRQAQESVEKQAIALMLLAAMVRLTPLVKATKEAWVMGRLRQQKVKQKAAQLVIGLWLHSVRYKRVFRKDRRLENVLWRFAAKCRQRRNIKQRGASADTIRRFLRDVRDDTCTNAFQRFKQRLRRAQGLARAFVYCRRARIEAMSVMWKRILVKKIAAERRLEAAYERALLNKVLQNEVLGDVVHKLEWWKSGVQRSLQKFQPNAAHAGVHTGELTSTERAILSSVLAEQRRFHRIQEEVYRHQVESVKVATAEHALKLVRASKMEVYLMSRSMCSESGPRKSNPFRMFTCHGQSLKGLLEKRATQYLECLRKKHGLNAASR